MLKTHCWRTTSLVMALTAILGFALPALGDDWRTFRGHAEEMLTGADTVHDDCLQGCQVTAAGAGRATHLGRFARLACSASFGCMEAVHGSSTSKTSRRA